MDFQSLHQIVNWYEKETDKLLASLPIPSHHIELLKKMEPHGNEAEIQEDRRKQTCSRPTDKVKTSETSLKIVYTETMRNTSVHTSLKRLRSVDSEVSESIEVPKTAKREEIEEKRSRNLEKSVSEPRVSEIDRLLKKVEAIKKANASTKVFSKPSQNNSTNYFFSAESKSKESRNFENRSEGQPEKSNSQKMTVPQLHNGLYHLINKDIVSMQSQINCFRENIGESSKLVQSDLRKYELLTNIMPQMKTHDFVNNMTKLKASFALVNSVLENLPVHLR